MKASTLTPTQTRGLAQAWRESMKRTTITLPATSTETMTFRRQLVDLSWTGNSAGDDFHFCFTTLADHTAALAILRTLRA